MGEDSRSLPRSLIGLHFCISCFKSKAFKMRFGQVSCVGFYAGRSRSLLSDKNSAALNTGCIYGWIYGVFIILIALIDLGSNIFFQHFFI